MQTVLSRLGMLRRLAQEFGPYLMLEILLPGGTLLALLLFVYRRRGLDIGSIVVRIALAVRVALANLLQQTPSVPRAYYFRPYLPPFQALSQPAVVMSNSGRPERL